MKKLSTLLLAIVMLFCFSVSAFAAETQINEKSFGDFEFSSEDMTQIISALLSENSNTTYFTATKEFDTSESGLKNIVTIEVTVSKNPLQSFSMDNNISPYSAASGTVNFAISGRYYFKSSDETVSNYGIHGSADYTGSSVKNANWNKYHDVVTKYSSTYSAQGSTRTDDLTDGKTFVGIFKLQNTSTKTWCDDATISMTVKNNGSWSSVGNFSAININ